jgi:hypothetical protein
MGGPTHGAIGRGPTLMISRTRARGGVGTLGPEAPIGAGQGAPRTQSPRVAVPETAACAVHTLGLCAVPSPWCWRLAPRPVA